MWEVPWRLCAADAYLGLGEDGALWIDLAELFDPIRSPYVQLTLSWSGADQQTIREWADRFVGQVGEL